MTKTKPTVKKPRPKYRVQLVKSNAEGQWLHRIVGRNGEKIESSELYVRRDSARRTAKPLAEALKTTLEVVDKSK
jgi:uncharacterized protein YegP (UPF0339 family)